MAVAENTWIQTPSGPAQAGSSSPVRAHSVAPLRIETASGYAVVVSSDQRLLTAGHDWIAASDIGLGMSLMLPVQLDASWRGPGTFDEGFVVGHYFGDGSYASGMAHLAVWGDDAGVLAVKSELQRIVAGLPHRSGWNGWHARNRLNGQERLATAAMTDLIRRWVALGTKELEPRVESASSDFCRGFLRGLFDADGHVEGTVSNGNAEGSGLRIVFVQSNRATVEAVQRMLARLGIFSRTYALRGARRTLFPDGRGGHKLYDCKASWRVVISAQHTVTFMDRIGFADTDKASKYNEARARMKRGFYRKAPVSTVASVEVVEVVDPQPMYDIHVEDGDRFDANGLVLRAA